MFFVKRTPMPAAVIDKRDVPVENHRDNHGDMLSRTLVQLGVFTS